MTMTTDLDLAIQQLVQQTTLLKAINGEMFTAHDVTRLVRSQVGRGVNVPHNEVKDIVHGLYESGRFGRDYTRTLANFPGVSPVPWIYHKKADNPANYKKPGDPSTYKGLDVSTPPQQSTLSIDLTLETCHVDARETLCIPAKYIREIGLVAGSVAYVIGDPLNNCVKVVAAKPVNNYAEYAVDRNNNVRITQSVLQRFGQAGKEYTVEKSGNFVKITRRR